MKRGSMLRQSAAVSAVLLAVLFLVPLAAVRPFRPNQFSGEGSPREAEREPSAAEGTEGQAVLQVLTGNAVEEMGLEEYLLGVIRAEMPADFESEALKAQTVAARTYTIYTIKSGGKHGGTADICTNPACCQAYLGREEAWERWGAAAENYEKKLEKAVEETEGQVILYGGEPILAVFHSSSAGQTRAAESVWQEQLPYLRPVASPEEGEGIPNYYSRAEFSAEEFRKRVLQELPEADLSGPPSGWLSRPVTDGAGNVETLAVGGMDIKGSRLRGILGLRSACFTWEIQEDRLVFYVTGYGHGVGMSQYGANQMAAAGADYREILTHYYTDVRIDRWNGGENFAISP